VLGLPLACIVEEDYVPSTREYSPYLHIFFEMGDGSYLAFFDLGDGDITKRDPDTPRWVNHIALEIADEAALAEAKSKLEAEGVDVLGPTDHGFVKSIYFFDPNDIRLELTCRVAGEGEMAEKRAVARERMDAWMKRHGRVEAAE
jgi:glyoxylase I family protein